MNREWAIPVALGLVAAAALLAVPGQDDEPEGPPVTTTATASSTPAPQPILLPFDRGLGEEGDNATFLVLAPLGKAALLAELNQSAQPEQADSLTWQGEHVALYTHPNWFEGCHTFPDNRTLCGDPPWTFAAWPLPRAMGHPPHALGPRLFEDGHNATSVTAFVFDAEARLVASNAPANETARFRLHDDFIRLPTGNWYLGGNETAPNGTAFLPPLAQPLVDRVRPQLEGLPAGGVATARSNAYVSLYGTLFVTIRIDSLVHAP